MIKLLLQQQTAKHCKSMLTVVDDDNGTGIANFI